MLLQLLVSIDSFHTPAFQLSWKQRSHIDHYSSDNSGSILELSRIIEQLTKGSLLSPDRKDTHQGFST